MRRKHQPRYVDFEDAGGISQESLTKAIVALVTADSEGGKIAQAVVAGLLDVFAGPLRVESGRINDPSRKYPGDVCVRSTADADVWEKAFEVRDKPVAVSDVQIFGKKCIDMGVREGAVVMVSDRQSSMNRKELASWAESFGLGLSIFQGWDTIIDQALFWGEKPKVVAAADAVKFIHARLLLVEASPAAVELWQRLTRKAKK